MLSCWSEITLYVPLIQLIKVFAMLNTIPVEIDCYGEKNKYIQLSDTMITKVSEK